MATTILLPELGGDLIHEITALEEWAIALEDEVLRHALGEVYTAATTAARQQPGRLLAPDGVYEYDPIRIGTIDTLGLAALLTALSSLSEQPIEALEEAAGHYHAVTGGIVGKHDPRAPVRALAALQAVLSLAEDTEDDAATLAAILADEVHAAGGGDIVLTEQGNAARSRLADRIIRAWGGDALQRWAMG